MDTTAAQRCRLIYLHGFNSAPASTKARQLQQWLLQQGLPQACACPALPHLPQAAIAVAEQAIAAALNTARESHAHGGLHMKKPRMPGHGKLHTGPIHSPVAGRTDHLPMHVPSGSYVIPADIISAMGEGNTMAGFKQMRRIFGGVPYTGGGEPYGGRTESPYNEPMPGKAEGGSATVPIVAAGGEYVLSPDQVRTVGEGDLDMGHKVLDEFVKRYRAETIKTLKKLPGPKRD